MSLVGLLLLGVAWAMSNNKKMFNMRTVWVGIGKLADLMCGGPDVGHGQRRTDGRHGRGGDRRRAAHRRTPLGAGGGSGSSQPNDARDSSPFKGG